MHEGCYDLSGKIKNIQVHIIFSFFGGGVTLCGVEVKPLSRESFCRRWRVTLLFVTTNTAKNYLKV